MDPERPIEKLLRQAAQARRAQAGEPQEVHPATRRMLQGEVARKFASGKADDRVGAPAPEKRSFFDLFMPRLAWGAALVVGLGLAASLMLPRNGPERQEMFLAKNDRVATVAAGNEAKARVAVPAEKPAPAAARPDSSALAAADSLSVAKAVRDKDSVNIERRRAEPERTQSLALNEPAAATSPVPTREAEVSVRQSMQNKLTTATASGGVPVEKQKEQLTETYSVAPAQTPMPQEEINQRRYGLGRPSQPAMAPGAAGVAAPSSVLKLGDETSKTELAYKSISQQATTNASSLAGQLKSAAAADFAKRSPAPIVQATQQFVQATSPKKTDFADERTAAKPILFSFELQQLGREVRIVDSDGSVYTGSFQPAAMFSYLESDASKKAAATRSLQTTDALAQRKDAFADAKLPVDMSYAFKVTGTNQTLKQFVVFTGQVLAQTNALSPVAPAGTVNGDRVARPELNPLPLQSSRVTGRALIGTNKEIEVNAIPSH
jgi:hypothetical protein